MYIKLTKASKSHNYTIEYYNSKGEKLSETPIKLSELDKKCSGNTKLRMKTGRVWGIVAANGKVLPVGMPKFMRAS